MKILNLSFIQFCFFCLLGLIFFQPSTSFATSSAKDKKDTFKDTLKEDDWIKIEEPAPEKTVEDRMIEGNIMVSEWFDSAADGLDIFLAGRRVTRSKNKTRFRVENNSYSVEGKSDVNNTTGLNIMLNLPNVEKFWKLKFTNYDEREEGRSIKRTYLRQTPREQNYGATVGFFKKLGSVRTSFEPRIELEDPLKISHSLKFESVGKIRYFRVNPKLEFFASPTKGIGAYQGLNFNFELTRKIDLTLINEGEYQEKIRTYLVTQGFSIGHYMTSKTSLSYTTLFSSNNRPNYHLEAYNFSVAYSQILYKKILDYSIIPNYEFAKSRSFKGLLGLTLNINLNF
jgi:hypothetical protein